MSKEVTGDEISLPTSWRNKPVLLVAVGAIALLLSVGWSYAMAPERAIGVKFFLHSYLTNYVYTMQFTFGALFFVLIQFLCRAGWSATIRRIGELVASIIPWMAVLFIPILLMVLFTKSTSLYEWNTTNPASEMISKKLGYLNGPFFAVRSVVYFLVFIMAANFVFRNSRKQDESGDANLTLKIQKWSGPLIMLYALALNFAAFDWVMSIDAEWYSTMFGVIIFAGGMVNFLSFTIIFGMALQKNGKLKKQITVENYHDLGKFLFGINVFWTYVSFSQFLLYWYGDIPEETIWFKIRMENGWQYLGLALIVGHFVLPFLGLMSRHVRRHRFGLTFWAVWLLFFQWLDVTYMVLPNIGPLNLTLMVGHFFGLVGVYSIFLAMLLLRSSDVPLLAARDPRLHEAVSYTNMLN